MESPVGGVMAEFVLVTENLKRMCDSFLTGEGCVKCPLSSENNRDNILCDKFKKTYPRETENIIMDWASKHPQETLLQDFLEKYPNAPLKDDGTPKYACPYNLWGYIDDKCSGDCISCWNRFKVE